MTLRATERSTYDEMWECDGYGAFSPGAHVLPVFLEMASPHPAHTILDAGCGTGKGALALKAAGFPNLTLCDLTGVGLTSDARSCGPFAQVALWSNLSNLFGCEAFDYVYCCDVLEHIPPMFTMLVAARLLEVSRRGVFFSIALTPDRFGVLVGKPLHQTVESFVTWRDALAELGTIRECRDLITAGVYLVEP